jgi:ABC-type Fe3+-hydroxamate transport system substrate-binding protein
MNVGGPDDEARRQSFRSRAGWGQVPAVRDNRIAFLDENRITRAGPRLVEGLEAVAAILEGVRAGAVLEENPAPPPRPAPETSTP